MLIKPSVQRVLITTLAVISGFAPVSVKAAPPQVIRDIEYAQPNGSALTLDVYRPSAGLAPAPVVVFVHGGGWKNGSKKSAEKTAAWLAEDGFAVVSINYRLTDVAQWPAQINDCYEAVRWVRRNADKYGFDPEKIGAWGTSAGAHLVALMGTRRFPDKEDVSSQIQAACDWFGPAELLTMPPNVVGNGRTEEDVAASNGAKLLGATVKDVPATARDASALNNVSADDCPFLIMHGSDDTGVPLAQSKKLFATLQQHGVPSTLHVVEGAGHGGSKFQSTESRRLVRQFFTKHLQRNWPQGSGASGAFSAPFDAPSDFSVVLDRNIRWKKQLPETGQSTVIAWGNRLYFSTMESVSDDSELGSNIVAWCCRADNGQVVWKQTMAAAHPLRLSGCFSDSSAPPPVTDGTHVVFFNASGRITCFNMDGEEIWTSETMPVGRTQPFLHDGNVIFIRQKYMPVEGHFTHEHKNAPADQWTNLQALNIADGSVQWTSTCGVNMGCVPLPVELADGRQVIIVGRGGGHSPPEKPEGISMISATDGATIWTLELPGFMSTQSYSVFGPHVLVFHGDRHLWVNVNTGKADREVSITDNVTVRGFENGKYTNRTDSLPPSKSRSIIQQSNLLTGRFHYFRSYTHPYIGRVDAETGNVEYLQVPVQVQRSRNTPDAALWDESQMKRPVPASRKDRPFGSGTRISYVAFGLNDVRNSRGHVVMGDDRSQGNGWGHHATAIPSVSGNHIYFPIMSGMVYVLDREAKVLDEDALVSISDLGPLNTTWTRSSLSFASHHIFARTIRELICIGE